MLPPRIVIVDDDMDEIIFFNEMIRRNYPNVDISFLTNPEGFVSYLESLTDGQLPEVIVSDLNMPKVNGLELLKQIKSSSKYCSIPFIIFSTSTNPLDKEKCMRAGAKDFIVKPLTLSQYNLIVDRIVKSFVEM